MQVAIPQLNFNIGDISGNTAKIIAAVQKAQEAKAELVIFPELAVCGPLPQDLLEREEFIQECRMAIEKIALQCTHIAAIVGAPNLDTANGIMYNSAYFIQNGEWILYNEESITQKSTETVTEFAYKGFSWFISINNDGRNCIGVDKENNIYVDRLIFQNYDRQIEKYDSDGNLVGWANIDTSNWFTMIPQKSIHVTQEGDIFLMACLEDKVVIMQIFLGNMD